MASVSLSGNQTSSTNLRPPIDVAQCKNIAVIKMDYPEDFILATPFLRGLRQSAPDATIDLVVTRESMPLAEICPLVDHVVYAEVKDTPDKKIVVEVGGNPDNVEHFRKSCESKSYDLTLVPRYEDDFTLGSYVAASTGAKRVIGFSVPPEPFATKHDYANAFYTDVIKRPFFAHETEHNEALLRYVNGASDTDTLDIWALQEDTESADRMLESAGIKTDRPVLTVFLGATSLRQCLPPEKLISILKRTDAMIPDLQLLVVGPMDMQPQAKAIASSFSNCVDLCGRATMRELVAIVAKSTAVASFGHMPAHIAAAVDVPSVLFSPHPSEGNPASRFSPMRMGPKGKERCVVLQPKSALWPCKQTCQSEGSHCIVSIGAEEAVEAIVDVIQKRMIS